MRVAVGADHRGFNMKSEILSLLTRLGHQAEDCGAFEATAVDYPDVAQAVALAVAEGRADLGVLVCGTGIGMSIAANKVPGIRAAACLDELTVELARQHNNANVLCLSADLLGRPSLDRVVEVFLRTPFEGGRHQRRVDKIQALERRSPPE